MNQYFPKPHESFGGDKAVLSKYATETNSKKVKGVDRSYLALKSNLAKSKAKVDKIDIDKFKTVPVDLSRLSNVVNSEVDKKKMYKKNKKIKR